MGLRGPGAKPIKRKATTDEPAATAPPPWEAKGLSRWRRVAAFIESLKITAGVHAGRRFKLRPWQKEILKALYKTDKRGRRIVRQALLTMPRKQGKTALAAALALAHLCGPEAEPRGQVFSAAADRAQAAIIFSEAVAMIQADPALSARIIIRTFTSSLEDAETGSTYKALSSDSKTKHGLSASFVVYDELAQAPNRQLFDVLATSTAARAEPLMLTISTMSADPHHVLSELVEYSRRIETGEVKDQAFYGKVYSAPMDAPPWDEATWHACNPALGDFRSLEEMRSAAMQAQRIPAREATFRLLYLNQPVSAESRFIPAAEWDACQGGVDPEELRGRPCWAGLDLSSTTDLTALVLYVPEDGGAVIPIFWVPRERLAEREERDRVPFPLWHKQGHLEAPEGRAIDRLAIARRLAEVAAKYDLKAVAYDRWRFEDLQKLLTDEGIELPLKPWGQGFKDMGPAVDALETAILSRNLRHDGHPVLAWNCSNVAVEIDPAGARKLSKAKAVDRIDGMVALVMAVGLHSREPGPKVYEVGDFPMVMSF